MKDSHIKPERFENHPAGTSTDPATQTDSQPMERTAVNDPVVNQSQERPLSRDLFLLLRHWLSQRRVQLVLGALLLGLGGWFNWDWLVAAGLAPLILAIAPCAVMCLMGMCMHKGHGKSGCHGKGSDDKGGNSPDHEG